MKKLLPTPLNIQVKDFLRSLFFALAIAAIAGSITMVIWIGSIDIIDGKMTSGSRMISFIYYAMIVGMSAGGIAELFSEIQGPFIALERVLIYGQILKLTLIQKANCKPHKNLKML